MSVMYFVRNPKFKGTPAERSRFEVSEADAKRITATGRDVIRVVYEQAPHELVELLTIDPRPRLAEKIRALAKNIEEGRLDAFEASWVAGHDLELNANMLPLGEEKKS